MPTAKKKLRFILVGGESLLTQCGELILARGHAILAVLSAADPIRLWARRQGVPVLGNPADQAAWETASPYDVLLSVANLEPLPPQAIARAAVAGVGFHDGPLPERAGFNAPFWALHDGASEYGVTWHLLTSQPGAGEILHRVSFEVPSDETALTLHARCYEAGLRSFEPVLALLERRRLEPLTQYGNSWHLHPREARPPAAGLVDWSRPAEEVERLVRATDYGPYLNAVGLAKTVVGDKPVCIRSARLLPQRSSLPPGSIVRVSSGSLVVATATVDLSLERLEWQDGRAAQPEELNLRAGDRILDVSVDRRERLSGLHRKAATQEPWWIRRLRDLEPGDSPLPVGPPDGPPVLWSTTWKPVPEVGTDARSVASGTAAFVWRLSGRNGVDVGWSDPDLTRETEGLEEWMAAAVPLRIAFDPDAPAVTVAEAFRVMTDAVQARGTYLLDLVGRTPELRSVLPQPLPLAIRIVSRETTPVSPLSFDVTDDGAITCRFDSRRVGREAVEAMGGRLLRFLESLHTHPDRPLGRIPLLTAEEQRALSQRRPAPIPAMPCIHRQIEAQARRSPLSPAVQVGDRTLSYQELDRKAEAVADLLRARGTGPDSRVGIALGRDETLLVAMLAVLKAGGAYVPIDPSYPAERIAFLLEDANLEIVLTSQEFADLLPSHPGILRMEQLDGRPPGSSPPAIEPRPEHLAYVLYTSGSTGRPKGVMVEHRQLAGFFAAMDQHLLDREPGRWLALTSVGFDIAGLELLWTLSRGFTVVLHDPAPGPRATPRPEVSHRPISFSLFFFASGVGGRDGYRLLLEAARFADDRGFEAVWTPERHFHAFGGLYPNPAVTGAALAVATKRIAIRAGSVVLPLHHPARVAEEWAVVDNLSGGRAGISFASGWQPNDFVLLPGGFEDPKGRMLDGVETVRRLWRGEQVRFPGPGGKEIPIGTLPRPVQRELPTWITSAGSITTFETAGRLGLNLLTHLLGQTVEELSDKITAYRSAWRAAGHPGAGRVTLMLHTFVGTDEEEVRAAVRGPLREYLRSSFNLLKPSAWSFSAFRRPAGTEERLSLEDLSPEEVDAVLEHAVERYYGTSGLFGTPERCLAMVDRLRAVGVDEIACLIDFGVDAERTLAHLEDLDRLRRMAGDGTEDDDPAAGVAAAIGRHGITHLQCTPPFAALLVRDDRARQALRGLDRILVGGDVLPPDVARSLAELAPGRVYNMYGPTEATIWATAHRVEGTEAGAVPLGQPLANTEVLILDQRLEPLPPGTPGEIVLGGTGIARGYLGRPDLTADRFPPHPLRPGTGERVYRTGDLGRLGPSGTLEFLGRLDEQVKIRGHRVEPGEVEVMLRSRPEVRDAVVVARPDGSGDRRLIGYVTLAEGQTIRPAELREILRQRLPEPMVPSHVVVLDSIPLTPNGKLDRHALPAPESGSARAPGAVVPPSTSVERTVAAVFEQVLGVSPVGSADNFFDLGGHSLLAIQAHRRLKEVLGRDLSLTDLFRFPTVSALAEYLSSGPSDAALQSAARRAERRRATLARPRTPPRPETGEP